MIRFVDFKASSIESGSFPIEIAWVEGDGHGESYLIRPAPEWLSPFGAPLSWSASSERLHGISMDDLMRDGTLHAVVAARAAAALSGPRVMAFSDAPPFDGQWLDMLLGATDLIWPSRLEDVELAYGWACRPLPGLLPSVDGLGRADAEGRLRLTAARIVTTAMEAEAMRPRTAHRALPDAHSL